MLLDVWRSSCVTLLCVQRGGLVAGALPGQRRERLHPQQLCGSVRLHPGRRVNSLHFFFPLLVVSNVSVFYHAHGQMNSQMPIYCFYVLWVGWETQSISDMRCDSLLIVKSVVKQLTLTLDPDFCTWESQQSSLFMLLSTLFKWTRVDVH